MQKQTIYTQETHKIITHIYFVKVELFTLGKNMLGIPSIPRITAEINFVGMPLRATEVQSQIF